MLLVVDTNLFHEFRPIMDLPWEELGEADEIVLVVTEPVQTELDEQKKSPRARIKRRAIEWTKKFRQLILADQTDIVLREAKPHVVVRLDGTRPDTQQADVLDLTVPDDCIVAIALALRSRFPDDKIAVFSDDLRPLRKARQVSIDAIEIPEDWQREPEQSEEDKARAQLEQQVALLRRQEPTLILSTSSQTPIEHVLPIYQALSDEQLDELMDILRQYNPIETDFEKSKRSSSLYNLPGPSFGVTRREFHSATSEEIALYREEEYPNWIEACRERLMEAHKMLGTAECGLGLAIELTNQGTRPALDLQIAFETHGAVQIMPGGDDEESRFMELFVPPFSLPKAPVAPQGEWKTYNPFDFAADRRSLGYRDLISPPVPRTFETVLREQQRDPNYFYYRDKPEVPVPGYSLTCAQFRHDDKAEHFEVLIRPSGDLKTLDARNAVVEVTCNASNLTSKVQLKIPLRFRCELRSTYEAIHQAIL